jgi:hypothetical protein
VSELPDVLEEDYTWRECEVDAAWFSRFSDARGTIQVELQVCHADCCSIEHCTLREYPLPKFEHSVGVLASLVCLPLTVCTMDAQRAYGLLRVYFYPSRRVVKALGVRAHQDDLFEDLPGLRRTVRRHVYMLM